MIISQHFAEFVFNVVITVDVVCAEINIRIYIVRTS